MDYGSGNAFLTQQSDLMDAVQRMRKKAQSNGNLKTSEQQKVETKVVENKQVIVIQQASPEVVYVPSYNPVVVYGPPVYPYPPIYYPPVGYYAAGMAISFGVGVAMGAAWGGGWGYGCGWGNNDVDIDLSTTTLTATPTLMAAIACRINQPAAEIRKQVAAQSAAPRSSPVFESLDCNEVWRNGPRRFHVGATGKCAPKPFPCVE